MFKKNNRGMDAPVENCFVAVISRCDNLPRACSGR